MVMGAHSPTIQILLFVWINSPPCPSAPVHPQQVCHCLRLQSFDRLLSVVHQQQIPTSHSSLTPPAPHPP
ncbi:hypothetical protein BDQ12DRAFT_677899 [Crucibulum laeve]|uniref:Secreted protein n=1 Tax=Crucibulum laeve TaxID=68775 RepID=A0A5C3MEF8_9AGAR|nr:hypothetical protein BDQ12DRAFT_677899 [Crucibulum laeve]